MKRIAFFALLLIPALAFSQLDKDAKSELATIRLKQADIRTHSIMVSGSTLTPFGIKYQYCRNFGGYVSFKTDVYLIEEDFIFSAGIVKLISEKSYMYLGSGIDFGYRESFNWQPFDDYNRFPGLEIEIGWLIKVLNGLSFEIGAGATYNDTDYGSYAKWEARGFLILGLGYSVSFPIFRASQN